MDTSTPTTEVGLHAYNSARRVVIMESLFKSSDDDYSDFASLLTCALCLGEFKEPMLLPCLHSLCRTCLDKFITASASSTSIQCPSCYKECKVGAAGAGAFQRNYFVYELKTILDNRAKRLLGGQARAQIPTRPSNGSELSNSGSHEEEKPPRKISYGSSVGEASMKGPPMCADHPTEQLNVYCKNCSLGLCAACSSSGHKLHWCKKLPTLAADFDRELINLNQSVEASLLRLGRIASDLDSKERRMLTDLDQTSMKVADTAQKLRDFVDQHEAYVHAKIRHIAQEGLELITTSRREVELTERSILGLKAYTEGLVAVGSLFDQASHIPGLRQHIKEQDNRLQSLKTVRWAFSADGGCATLRQISSVVGDVSGELTSHNVYWAGLL